MTKEMFLVRKQTALALRKKLEDARVGNFGKSHAILDKDWKRIFKEAGVDD